VARLTGTGEGSAISRLPKNVSAIQTEEDQELVPGLAKPVSRKSAEGVLREFPGENKNGERAGGLGVPG